MKKISFIIIPPGQSSWNFDLSFRTIWFIVGVLSLLLVISVLAVVSLGFLAQQIHQVRLLERENQKLLLEREKIEVLQTELSRSQNKLNQLLALVGIDSTMTTASGEPASAPLLAGMGLMNQNSGMGTMNNQFSTQELNSALLKAKNAQKSMPSIWPTKGIVSQKFHWGDGYGKKHPGLDIATAEGTPIAATADGQVVLADWDNALGFTVMIDHQNGYSTLYGHNSRLLVSNGAIVTKGQTIALSGNTGRSSAPHLHYEVRKMGTPLDPVDFLTN